MMKLRALFLVLIAGIFPGVEAATFNIPNGDVLALRNAINTCNTNGQDDIINLATNGTYTITGVDHSTSADGMSGLPVITVDSGQINPPRAVTINGNHATIARSTADGIPKFRLLRIDGGTVTINNISFANGYIEGGDINTDIGGGIFINGPFANVVLNDCTIANCYAYYGGGIADAVYLKLNRCTLTGNTAAQGGGAFYLALIHYPSTVTMTGCTIFRNFAAVGMGNGFYVAPTGDPNYGPNELDLIGCTAVSSDFFLQPPPPAASAPESILTFASTLLKSCAISNPENAIQHSANVYSRGWNLSYPATGRLTLSTDQEGVDPHLDPAGLADNGGPTQTVALFAGSPAIDKGYSFSVATDQRGNARIYDNSNISNTADGADIGAYEAPADQLQDGSPSYVVTNLSDHDDGACSGADCTLREAIEFAESSQGLRSVTFAPGVDGTVTLAGSEIFISRGVQINGPGARSLAISANNQSRVFTILASSTISGLTIRDGYVSGAAGSSNVGGGIYNASNLTLSDCAIVHNRVLGGSGTTNTGQDGGAAWGGGIYNGGTLTLTGCTIGGADANTANSATGGTGAAHPNDGEILYTGGKGGAGLGGAIYNDTNGTLTINSCTIAGDIGTGGTGGAGNTGGAGGEGAGGIYNAKTMTVTGSTISANSGNGGAGGHGQFTPNNGAAGRGIGGLHTSAGTATIRSSIIAANTHTQAGGIDVEGAFVSGGFNLIGTASNATGFTNATDLAGTNTTVIAPLLGPIQNNGGTTDTMALLTGSPALDHGNSFGLTSDQRGRAHSDDPVLGNPGNGDGTDTGAYESSYARIVGINRGGAATTITFIGTVGRQFQLQRRFSFTGAWTTDPFSQNTVLSAGQTMQLMDLHANDSSKIYYRIQEL